MMRPVATVNGSNMGPYCPWISLEVEGAPLLNVQRLEAFGDPTFSAPWFAVDVGPVYGARISLEHLTELRDALSTLIEGA